MTVTQCQDCATRRRFCFAWYKEEFGVSISSSTSFEKDRIRGVCGEVS